MKKPHTNFEVESYSQGQDKFCALLILVALIGGLAIALLEWTNVIDLFINSFSN